nr:nucleoside deaminase [Corynebacterium sp. 366]
MDAADERWMRRAFEVASATPAGDVPVGAVIVSPQGQELGCGTNRREADGDPLGHAEIAAMREAVGIDGWRLTGCTAYVTLEPCAMCAGALVGARVHRIVFASYEPNTGACGSVWDIPREHPLHKTQVRGGVLEEQGTALLSEFFARLRG